MSLKIVEFHHVCIQTSAEKYKESLAFYVELMGFELIKETCGFHTRDFNTWLKAQGVRVELQTPKKGTRFERWSKFNSGPVHICIVVDDVKKAYEFIKRSGYEDFKVKNGKELYSVEGSYLFKLKAPEGTEVEVRDNRSM